MIKKVFKIEGMHCASCAMKIDGELEDTAGVKDVRTNYAKQLTEVEYDESLIDEGKVAEVIKKAGYSVVLPRVDSNHEPYS